MNIPMFGLPSGTDPTVYNEYGTINYKVWYFVEWFPEGTQRALFSMLFGAGIILFVSGKEKKLDGLWPADYFFRRQLWLIAFSLFDVFVLLWFGDILLDYAIFGMLLFTFRKLPPKGLLIAAGVCFLFMFARENRDLYQDKKMITRGEAIAALDTSKVKLTPLQTDRLKAMIEFKEESDPKKKREKVNKSIEIIQGDHEGIYEMRTDKYLGSLVQYMFYYAWDVLCCMLLGMALFKMKVLTGQARTKVYLLMTLGGFGVGLLLSWCRIQNFTSNGFNIYEYTKNVSVSFYEPSRIFRSIGFLGFILLLYKSGLFKWLFALMRPVGQMAFTNYLMQSLICGLFFYGIGFGMYGKLDRLEVYYFVAAVWVFQIIYSHLWLRYFYFGPLEWLWRSLTYWKKQRMLKKGE